jgi:hypothetical protein
VSRKIRLTRRICFLARLQGFVDEPGPMGTNALVQSANRSAIACQYRDSANVAQIPALRENGSAPLSEIRMGI